MGRRRAGKLDAAAGIIVESDFPVRGRDSSSPGYISKPVAIPQVVTGLITSPPSYL